MTSEMTIKVTTKKASVTIYEHATCGTCRKALKWLTDEGVSFERIPIATKPPSRAELASLVARSGRPIDRWFNTSGGSYRALLQARGKDAVKALSEDEILTLLAGDGMLIKRPIVVTKERVLVGFDATAYEALLREA